jgi:hypothetical protein
MINYYFYDNQIKSYLLQFCNIFAGLKVMTGKGESGEPEFMSVPITIGSKDRVVAAIQAGNTQNKPFSLPIMAAYMTNISLAPTRKGIGVVDKRVFLPAGGIYPDDLKTVTRVMPIPYLMSAQVSIYASNTDQMMQILEQLLVLFDPVLQIQTSDSAFDWTKITTVELTAVTNEENYPSGLDKRIIQWSLEFEIPIYISMPADIRDEMVRRIIVQLGDLDGFNLNEFDDEGNLVPFAGNDLFATISVSAGE